MTRLLRVFICVSLLTSAASSLRAFPNQLAYFNEVAGGPRDGHCHLLHSNIDWSQDLPAIQQHFHNYSGDLWLAWSSWYDPAVFGVEYRRPLAQYKGEPDAEYLRRLPSGAYVISISLLCGGGYLAPDWSGERGLASGQGYAAFSSFGTGYRLGGSIWVYEKRSCGQE